MDVNNQEGEVKYDGVGAKYWIYFLIALVVQVASFIFYPEWSWVFYPFTLTYLVLALKVL